MFGELRADGASLLISTHMIDSVENYWDVAHIMMHGRLAAVKRPDDATGRTLPGGAVLRHHRGRGGKRMKGAMGYLVFTRLKAQVREVFKRPSRLIYLLLLAGAFWPYAAGRAAAKRKRPRATRASCPSWPGRFTG